MSQNSAYIQCSHITTQTCLLVLCCCLLVFNCSQSMTLTWAWSLDHSTISVQLHKKVLSHFILLTWKDLMKVQSSVRMPSPRDRSFTSLITRNSRKNVIEILALSSVFWRPFFSMTNTHICMFMGRYTHSYILYTQPFVHHPEQFKVTHTHTHTHTQSS